MKNASKNKKERELKQKKSNPKTYGTEPAVQDPKTLQEPDKMEVEGP